MNGLLKCTATCKGVHPAISVIFIAPPLLIISSTIYILPYLHATCNKLVLSSSKILIFNPYYTYYLIAYTFFPLAALKNYISSSVNLLLDALFNFPIGIPLKFKIIIFFTMLISFFYIFIKYLRI